MSTPPFLRRLFAVIWARNIEFLRDWSALGWNLLLPLLLVLGLAFMFSGAEKPLFKVAVMSDSGTIDAKSHPFLGTRYIEFFSVSDRDASIRKVERHRLTCCSTRAPAIIVSGSMPPHPRVISSSS